MFSNADSGWLPERNRPFTKNPGVPLMPCSAPSSTSFWMAAFGLAARKARIERRLVERDFGGELPEGGVTRVRSRGVDAIVELPELALLVRAPRRLRRTARLRVQAVEREVLVHEPHLPRILREHLQTARAAPMRQYGQWKSENSTIVMGALTSPRTGAPSVTTAARKTGGASRRTSTFAFARSVPTNAWRSEALRCASR